VVLTCDVVVIGSGAGGAVAAARFAESGRAVVILEEGEYLHAPDFNEREGALVPRLFAEQAMRTTSDASVTLLQGGAVGGGTTVNWMTTLRPGEDVLDEWSRVSGIRGFSMKELAPHFDRVGEEIHARTPPPDAHSPANRAILEGARALGWRAGPGMINAKGCVQAGTCSMGCRYDAKQGALMTYLPSAFAAGARLYTGATVDRIEVIERERRGATPPRKRVHATIRDPRAHQVRGRISIEAPIVVLAAGAVGTPVILERSGLGGGGVGRFLRLHPTTAVLGHYEREIYPLAGIPQTALCDEFIRRDANGYGFWIETAPLQPALASAALQGFGAEHRRYMQLVKHTIPFIVLVRDGSGSEESMGSVSVSRAGRVRVRHQLTPYDRVNLRLGIEAAARLQLAAGALEVLSLHTPMLRAVDEAGLRAMGAAPVSPNRVGLFSAHVNGTCRLGVNPVISGCSPTGERHGVRGLYVMDGSLLPTSPGVNPQWTIMAMASLLAGRAVES
jgi:choline dehydrogenase-like flavoprotein